MPEEANPPDFQYDPFICPFNGITQNKKGV